MSLKFSPNLTTRSLFYQGWPLRDGFWGLVKFLQILRDDLFWAQLNNVYDSINEVQYPLTPIRFRDGLRDKTSQMSQKIKG